MRLHRVIAYLRADSEAVIEEQSGDEVVSSRDMSRMVRLDSGHYFKRTADWMPTRDAAIRVAISEMEKAAASAQATIADLRNRLLSVDGGPLPAAAAAIHGRRESAAGGRNETPASCDRSLPAGA